MTILKREVLPGPIDAAKLSEAPTAGAAVSLEATLAASSQDSITPPSGWEECETPDVLIEPGVKLWIDGERGIDMTLGEMLARRTAIYIRPAPGALPR